MESAATVKRIRVTITQMPIGCEFDASSFQEVLDTLRDERDPITQLFALAKELAGGEPVADSAVTVTADAVLEAPATGKPKRKRRTDAEIAADEARIAAASAPAPLAIPGAPTAAPPPPPLAVAPPVVPVPTAAAPQPPAPITGTATSMPPVPIAAQPAHDLQVPDFLKHPGNMSAIATTTSPVFEIGTVSGSTAATPPAPVLPPSIAPATVMMEIGKGSAEILAELSKRSAGNAAVQQQCVEWVASFKHTDGSHLIIAPAAKWEELAAVLPMCRNDSLAQVVAALELTVAA